MLFQKLLRDPGTAEWTVLHSLNLANHPSQVCGEVDFVVIAPDLGVLCLEVKAHRRVTRDTNGNWLLGGRVATRSPFVQADGQMRSVMQFLHSQEPALSNVPVFCAVWFTNCRIPLNSNIEWHDWQLLDQDDLSRPVAQTLAGLFHKARTHLAAKTTKILPSGPTSKTCQRAVQALRPEFEFASPQEPESKHREMQISRFTEEQYDALDTMERAPRVIFSGHAGTGKTFLGLEVARRAVLRGQTPLLLCYNRLLASWLRDVAPQGVEVATLHAFMCRISNTKPPLNTSEAWWRDTLPDLAIQALLEGPTTEYDLLIVDEAQDLMTSTYLDVLDLSLTGGLTGGSWRMFGDFERQTIFNRGEGTSAVTARASDAVEYILTKNCRNTPRVGKMATTLAGLNPGYKGFRRPDDGVNVSFATYASNTDQERILITALNRLTEEGFIPEDIVILSSSSLGIAATSENSRLRAKLCRLDQPRAARVRHGTVHSFKGLDAPAVIMTDVQTLSGPSTEDLMYIAMTRTTGPLIMLVDREIAHDIAQLALGGAADA
ncbi:NERD domain-containing protein [Lentzea chajnantorensis]